MSLNDREFPPILPLSADTVRPFWSVVIPVYNRLTYLQHCLNAVLEQDPGPDQMQILVMDDASDLDIRSAVQAWGRNRVEYYRNPENLRQAGSFNAAVTAARGQWIHLLNDDDWVLPGYYQTLQAALASQPDSVGAAFCRYTNTDAVGNRVWVADLLRSTAGLLPNWLSTIAIGNPLHPSAAVIRRSVYEHLGGYHPDCNYATDWELYKRIAVFYDWWYEPEILMCYRQHDQNATQQHRANAEQAIHLRKAIELSETYLPEHLRDKLSAIARRNHALLAFNLAFELLQSGSTAGAITAIQEALRLSRDPSIQASFFQEILVHPEAAPIRAWLLDRLTA